jgi:hypothetical protein
MPDRLPLAFFTWQEQAQAHCQVGNLPLAIGTRKSRQAETPAHGVRRESTATKNSSSGSPHGFRLLVKIVRRCPEH